MNQLSFTDRPPLRIKRFEDKHPALERKLDLTAYDVILINTSAGKDSQSMMHALVEEADRQGVRDRCVAVHADLGRVEWKGTLELAQEQADHYGVRLIVCRRTQNDLLDHIRAKHQNNLRQGKVQPPMPSPAVRDCTSEHKRGPIRTVMTALVREWRNTPESWEDSPAATAAFERSKQRRCRILNCTGIRAQEGEKRRGMCPFEVNSSASNKTMREVTDWYPIFNWTEDEVWACIRKSGCAHHPAYDLGMPRLSCVFCIFGQKPQLLIAGYHNPELLAEYVAVEQETGYSFKSDLALGDVQAELQAGWKPDCACGGN